MILFMCGSVWVDFMEVRRRREVVWGLSMREGDEGGRLSYYLMGKFRYVIV